MEERQERETVRRREWKGLVSRERDSEEERMEGSS